MGPAPEKKPERRLLDLWVAAVTKIVQCSMQRDSDGDYFCSALFRVELGNGPPVKREERIKSRASLGASIRGNSSSTKER